jgi:hypothetical protein
MPIPQSTIAEIIESERQLVLDAPLKYGEYYGHALDASAFLSRCIKSVNTGQEIAARFHSQVKKHHTLAVFSIVRLHKVQAMMNLRQALEAGASAAFAIRNPEPEHFVDQRDDGLLDAPQSLARKRYKWLDDNFPAGSQAIKRLKDTINATTAHANLINTSNNFTMGDGEAWATAAFFDAEDDHLLKTDLWLAGNIAIGLADLLYGVASTTRGIVFCNDFEEALIGFNAANQQLRDQMIATDRYKRAMARAPVKP